MWYIIDTEGKIKTSLKKFKLKTYQNTKEGKNMVQVNFLSIDESKAILKGMEALLKQAHEAEKPTVKKKSQKQKLKSFTRFTVIKEVPEPLHIYYKVYEYTNGRVLAFREVENMRRRIIYPAKCVQLKELYRELPFLKALNSKTEGR